MAMANKNCLDKTKLGYLQNANARKIIKEKK